MNRFEQAVYDCMNPVEELLQRTENPLHRAILENFRRHVHLEGSGQFDKIIAPDMTVDNPVYRVSWGDHPALIEGKEGVVGFYNSVTEAVLWNSDDLIAVNDWGIADELTFNQLIKGSDLQNLGYTAESPDAHYHLRSRQAFIWPYNEKALLKGENLYEDKTSVEITQVDESELITPQRVAEIHREQLARLEAEKGPNWWVYS